MLRTCHCAGACTGTIPPPPSVTEDRRVEGGDGWPGSPADWSRWRGRSSARTRPAARRRALRVVLAPAA
eukprot:1919318-Pyramimonas_sp.AAC.1